MRDIFTLEKTTKILSDGSYLSSYPYIQSYFQRLEKITAENVVLGSHMVYGWMPTILDLYIGDKNISLDDLVEICNRARTGELLGEAQLDSAASVINNSLVGASKLLHFINPSVYPIWDSKIYKFIHEKQAHSYRVSDSSLYLEYIDILKELQKNSEFKQFHQNVNSKIGYDVSPVRAMELIMFLNSP